MLAACSLPSGVGTTKIDNPAPPGIAYRYHGSLADARRKAESYCREWGKAAKLDQTVPSGADHIASFACT